MSYDKCNCPECGNLYDPFYDRYCPVCELDIQKWIVSKNVKYFYELLEETKK